MFSQKETGRPIDKERDTIRIFMKNLGPSNPGPVFETDAQPFRINGNPCLFSTDEFSSEDNFRSHHPMTLGWNLAAATISDIFAAGGEPVYFGHSVTIQYDWDEHFIDQFSKGIALCLKTAGTGFLGGDMGMADKWRYTGIAIGHQLADINRSGARAGDSIYTTGHIGAGNLEAALQMYSGNNVLKPFLDLVDIRFPVRMLEAALIRKYAHCCIDSSDGLLRALLDLTGLSGTGFRVSDVPYHRQGKMACLALGKPVEILFFGECGEYELVFTVSPEDEARMLHDAQRSGLDFFRIGTITEEPAMTYENGIMSINLEGYSLFARNFQDVHQYIDELTNFIHNGRR